tara:strand:+ start:331 stop:558 length:228 start_codon:yes stop_codon:yes gene_type:complete
LQAGGDQRADVLPLADEVWRDGTPSDAPLMAKQMKELEKENARLKTLVADQALDMLILKEAAHAHCLNSAMHYTD